MHNVFYVHILYVHWPLDNVAYEYVDEDEDEVWWCVVCRLIWLVGHAQQTNALF